MELLWLIEELTKLRGIFYTSRSRLFIDVRWGFVLYSLGASIQVCCIKLNYNPGFSFLEKDWFDHEFLNFHIHMVHITRFMGNMARIFYYGGVQITNHSISLALSQNNTQKYTITLVFQESIQDFTLYFSLVFFFPFH